jgi:hypothetical protein
LPIQFLSPKSFYNQGPIEWILFGWIYQIYGEKFTSALMYIPTYVDSHSIYCNVNKRFRIKSCQNMRPSC